MATTRIMSMHINKGKTISQCLKERVEYIKNPDKTEGGELISSYACSPETADHEFLLARNAYLANTGKSASNLPMESVMFVWIRWERSIQKLPCVLRLPVIVFIFPRYQEVSSRPVRWNC